MISNREVIKELNKLKENLLEAIKHVSRKHWRDSEKAMTVAAYRRRIEALDKAIDVFEARDKDGVI